MDKKDTTRAYNPIVKDEGRINDANQEYLDNFIGHLEEEENVYDNTLERYQAEYRNFLMFCNDVPLEKIDDEVISRFFSSFTTNVGDATKYRYVNQINRLCMYSKENYPDRFSNFTKLKNIRYLKRKKPEIEPLTQVQLNYIKSIFDAGFYRAEKYIFFVLYYLGVDRDYFEQYNPRYLEEGSDKDWPDELKKIYQDVKHNDISYEQVSVCFNLITSALVNSKLFNKDRKFSIKDIKNARKDFFFKCPCCGELVENISDNWMVVNYDMTPLKSSPIETLVCRQCKGVYQDEVQG